MKEYQGIYTKRIIKADNSIDNNYYKAIQHYTKQKEAFKNKYKIECNKTYEQLFDEISKSVNEQLLNMEISENDEEVKNMLNELEKIATNLLNENGFNKTSFAKDYRTRYKNVKSGKAAEKNFYTNLKESIGKNITTNIKDLFRESPSLWIQKSVSNSAVYNQIFGILRKIILEQYMSGRKREKDIKLNFDINKSLMALKGLKKEEVLNNVLNNFFPKFESYITGGKKNEKKQEIKYDIVIGNSTNISNIKNNDDIYSLLDEYNGNFMLEGKTDIKDPVFGVQSKSWIAPWEETTKFFYNKWSLSFGYDARFMPLKTSELSYYWHWGMYKAMSNMIAIIGEYTTFYSTGAKLYFTADLLSQFRRAEYVLAYKQKEGKATSEVAMQKHNDN